MVRILPEAEIRCFESAEEIRDLNGFRDGNPLNKQSYRRLVGYYNLPEKLFCCMEKANGNLCKHEHGKGWVVEKTDGSHTLLGKDCANDKFDADPRLIKDIQLARNAIRRRTRLEKIYAHLEKRTERTRAIEELQAGLDSLYSRAQTFMSEIGQQTSRRLLDMHRSGSTGVSVTAVKFREYVEDGRTRQERSTFSQRLGVFTGLAILTRDSYTPIQVSISNIIMAFDAAVKLPDRPKKGEVEALVSRLDSFDHVMMQGRALLAEESKFFNSNMELLCYLVDDRSERYKNARFAMRHFGIQGNKDQAKSWLSSREAQLCAHLGIDRIEIR